MLAHSQLGKVVNYESTYNSSLLFAIPRALNREVIGINPELPLPFHGVDIWNAHEVSWLNEKNKPEIRIAEIYIPCDSENLIESKSLKLYLNSFNNTNFKSESRVIAALEYDISKIVDAKIKVKFWKINEAHQVSQLLGITIDDLEVECTFDHICIEELKTASANIVEETLYSDLLKSNCPVTGQPDWATIQIRYKGQKIDQKGLLKYIVSFRNSCDFHENIVEKIYLDIMNYCKPEFLEVYARFTRRGGIDINPFRSTEKSYKAVNSRLIRQ